MIRILNAEEMPIKEILLRRDVLPDVSGAVSEILAEVCTHGDRALLSYTQKFDGAALTALELTRAERDEALKKVDPVFLSVLEEAAGNIRAYHRKQLRSGYVMSEREGIVLGQRILPLAKVGLYVPGGTASYPSTVLMDAIPAKLAGVGELVMTTPPSGDGQIFPNLVAAAEIAGVDRIFCCGGAQAIAALAYGTETIPQVDKIVGPGNVYVAEAKRQVFGRVAIDMIAGPSEILAIADEDNDPVVVAADLLSQAEHDKMAAAVLITTSAKLAGAVADELERQLKNLPREAIARSSIENNGKIILVESVDEAIDIANAIAPEHLELLVSEPFSYLCRIQNAGSVFLGRNCPEPLGDYFAGTNHTLPTGGTARFSSPLGVDDFVKKSSFMYYSADALGTVGEKIALFAETEGLHAHAVSAVIRSKEGVEK